MIQTMTKTLKANAHHLKPIVRLGVKGLTPEVLQEIDQALAHHELMKIKISSTDKDLRKELAQNIALELKATLISQIGSIVVLYRMKKE